MVKRNTPDWQISAFDKDNNSYVKTKPFNEKIKELEAAYAKGKQTTVKVEDIDVSTLSRPASMHLIAVVVDIPVVA